MKAPKRTAEEIAQQTHDAYSCARYGKHWQQCAAELLALGFSDKDTETILRSKLMRWAADNSTARYGNVPAKAIVRFYQQSPETFAHLLKEARS